MLDLGNFRSQAGEIARDDDLAGKAAVRSDVLCAFEHVAFHRFSQGNAVDPFGIDVYVTRGTGTRAAAVGQKALDPAGERALHQASANRNLDAPFFSRSFNKVHLDCLVSRFDHIVAHLPCHSLARR